MTARCPHGAVVRGRGCRPSATTISRTAAPATSCPRTSCVGLRPTRATLIHTGSPSPRAWPAHQGGGGWRALSDRPAAKLPPSEDVLLVKLLHFGRVRVVSPQHGVQLGDPSERPA